MRSIRPNYRYRWQFPIAIKIDRWYQNFSIALIFRSPLVRILDLPLPTLSGWLLDDD